MKIAASIFKTLFLCLCIIANTHLAYAQTASILPQGKTQFLDNNGKPLTSGTVDFYIPSTTTRKTTWQNSAETIANANPVVLDAGGRAIIYGDGSYRQVVKDRLGNIIWDQLTSSTGSGGGSTPTATGDGDLVGTIKPWAGMTAPNQYQFTYGQEVSRVTYSALFTAITSTQPGFCTSGSPTISGLSDTTNFWIGMSVETSCVAAGFTTVVSKTSSTVDLAVNANVTTNSNIIFFPWGNGNHTTTFNLPDFRGFAIAGNNIMGGVASSILTTTYFGATDPNSSGAAGGSQSNSITLLTANLPAYTPAGTITNGAITTTGTVNGTPAQAGSTGGSSGGSGISTPINANNLVLASSQAASTFVGSAQGGTSTAIVTSRVQPTKTSNYIIKITPDANSATASGVTSLGGMTGDIACGSGLLCTGNNISISNITVNTDNVNYTAPFSNSVTETQTVKNSQIINIGDFGAKCDGTTDDTTAIINAIAATPYGATLKLKVGSCLVVGSGSQIFNITKPIKIIGDGSTASGAGSAILVSGTVPSTRDIFKIVGVVDTTTRGYTFSNFDVSAGSAAGKNVFHFDSTAGTTTNFAEVLIDGVYIATNASAGGYSIIFDNGSGININGGIFNATVSGQSYIGNGISCLKCGDSIRILNNIITGPNAAVTSDQIAGAGQLIVSGNNVTSTGGGVIVLNGIAPIIENNEFEQIIASTETNNSIIDFTGSVGNISNGKIVKNQVQTIAGTATPIRINAATNTVIDSNRIATPSAYAHIVLTAASANTLVTSGNLFAGGGSNISDAGTSNVALTYAGNFTTAGAFSLTLTTTATTNATLPAGTQTLAGLNVSQTWTNTQNFVANSLVVNGATSGFLIFNCAAICGSNTITFPAGTTNFSATGGTGQVIKQTSLGGAFTVSTIANTDLAGLGTGVATALGINVGTAGAFVVNGGALGSPSSVGTLPAHTLGGTISGGGNQINNVIIGASTPLAGNFTTLGATGLVTVADGSSAAPSIHGGTAATGFYTSTSLVGLASSGGSIFSNNSNTFLMQGSANNGPVLTLGPVSGGGAAAVSTINLNNFGAGASGQNALFAYNARGVVGTPTAISNGDPMFLFGAAGSDGTNIAGTLGFDAGIQITAAANFTTSNHPTNMTFFTTPSSTKVATAALNIGQSGGVSIGANAIPAVNNFSASVYFSGSTTGVTCAGAPTGSFASTGGIVTHC